MTIEKLSEISNSRDRSLVRFLQRLVQIPSWVPDELESKSSHNENEVVDYLENWIKTNTNLQTKRQTLDGGRYNLIATKGRPDLLFLAHTDTVEKSLGAPYGPFKAEIHQGKIWGLGTTDMKSGITTMLQAISLAPDANNVWAFLYADEEKDFLGMHGLLKDYSDLHPKLIVSSDGSDLKLGHGCRGLIELRGVVRGVSGHPAKGNGISATVEGFRGLFELQEELSKYKHQELGGTSLNVTDVLGGKLQDDSFDSTGKLVKITAPGNEIPDVMQFRLDIRPGNPDLSFERVVNLLNEIMTKRMLKLEITEKKHSYGAWYTDLGDLGNVTELVGKALGTKRIELDNPGESGYLDLQMLWEATGRPPAFVFGGGNGATAHKPDENIDIEKLIKERDFFLELLKNFKS